MATTTVIEKPELKMRNGNVILFQCTDRRFDLAAERARQLGRQAMIDTGCRVDPDQNLCAVQMEAMSAGYTLARVDTNIYGFCVRDTNNYGGGRLSPNFPTAGEALAWARRWYEENPSLREVICYESDHSKLMAAN